MQPIVQKRFPGFPGDCVGREDGLHSLTGGGIESIIPAVASGGGGGGAFCVHMFHITYRGHLGKLEKLVVPYREVFLIQR